MSGKARVVEWLPAVLAAAAFAGFAAAFVYELFSYQQRVVEWATGDVNSRAHLAAANLEEPLRTQDFESIRRIGEACEADGVHLLVTSGRGGIVFRSQALGANDLPIFSERMPSGEYWVSVGLPQARVLAPFRRAIRGFLLAGLVGMAGVLLFFFVTYRQRVRIRELARIEKFRREFIADVSHEIKTPLTGILGAVDLLDAGGDLLQGTGATLVGMIKKESKRLNGLVQSILDLARLEREGEALNLAEVDLTEMVRETAERFGVATGRIEGSDGSHDIVVADAMLLSEAIANLVENAKRHSGTDDITLSLERDGVERIVVEDHGVGIPPEHAGRVFERFHRVDPARAAETGGAGLGLAIVRRIARLHGGDVTLRAARPHGCRFELTLPI